MGTGVLSFRLDTDSGEMRFSSEPRERGIVGENWQERAEMVAAAGAPLPRRKSIPARQQVT